jgi:hypothetical protein
MKRRRKTKLSTECFSPCRIAGIVQWIKWLRRVLIIGHRISSRFHSCVQTVSDVPHPLSSGYCLQRHLGTEFISSGYPQGIYNSWIRYQIYSEDIVSCWQYLLCYRPSHSIIHTPFIADYTVGITIALWQTVLSLTVLTIHSFCRLSWPSTISVGARLFTADSRLSLSLLSPTTNRLWLDFNCDFYWLQLPSHCLKKGLAGPKWEHLPLLFTYAL